MLLIIFLNLSFKLYYSSKFIVDEVLTVKGIRFIMEPNSKNNEGFIGFFDWLRNDNGLVKGIRLCFFEHQGFNEFLTNLKYVNPSFENKCMEILFEGDYFNHELSGDQDFTNNYVYQSESGEYLFTFGLDNLTEKELESVLVHCEKISS